MNFVIRIFDIIYFCKNSLLRALFKNRNIKDSLAIVRSFHTIQSSAMCELLDSSDFSVIIIEFNLFHFETLQGVQKYFEQLGYKSAILIRSGVDTDGLGLQNVLFAKLDEILFIANNLSNKILYFNTMILSLNENFHILNIITPKSKFLGTYHTISDIAKYNDYTNYIKDRYFALRDITYKDLALKGLNCVSHIETKLMGGGKITFVSIGFPLYHRGFRENLVRVITYLLDCKIKDFKFILIGRNSFPLEKLYKFIEMEVLEVKIGLDSTEVTNILHNTHYIFSLYDNFAHKAYLRTSTSGQRQISLGGAIPLIISMPFARAFGLSDREAIIYNNDLKQKMLLAYKIAHSNEYIKMKHNLETLNKSLCKTSMENLKYALNNLRVGENA